MLSHLVYVSNRKPNCTEEEIDKILSACQKNNAHLDVTGVLLYSDTHFVQYLEGSYKQIMSLYDKIKGDDRHKNPVLITSAPIPSRLFPNWQMGAKKITSTKIDFKTEITPQDKEVFQDILSGKQQEGNRALQLMQKVFK